MGRAKRVAFPTEWLFAPEWLTFEQACFLSGWDSASMETIIEVGGVDLNDAGLIEKQSLWEFQEASALVRNWEL